MRYSLTFTDRPGAKARYRQALKLMGAENVRIEEREEQASDPKPAKDNCPTSEDAKAVATLFHRPHDRPWSDAEITLFRTARKTGAFTTENMKLITKYYERERGKNDDGVHRRDLKTFLSNAGGELDRAKAVKGTGSRALEWSDSTPKIIALPDPAEAERLRAQAKAGLAAFREGVM